MSMIHLKSGVDLLHRRTDFPSSKRQRGVTTLVIVMILLVILTLIVLASSSVALFEQRTATNENRQRLADSAAEYALRLGGEFFKANIVNIASTETGGWLAAATSRWQTCAGVTNTAHPCFAEANAARRNELYFYTFNGSTAVDYSAMVTAGAVTSMGGATAAFPVTTTVTALLCRLDTTLVDTADVDGDGNTTEIIPACRATPNPSSNNRIAFTLVASATLTNENARAEVKETWANFDTFATASAVPLIASGVIDGTGNVEIVTSPNGGGTGIPVSLWTPADADIECSGGGSCASIATCHVGEFLKSTPLSGLQTTCRDTNNACGCPAPTNASTPEMAYAKNPNMLSGKIPSASCCENIDVLDRDGNLGANQDIQFFPGQGLDDVSDLSDDSLFEWVFQVSDESDSTRSPINGSGNTLMNCGQSADQNCAIFNLTEPDRLNATSVTCAALNTLGVAASGLYYVSDSSAGSQCDLSGQIGSPETPAIVVINERARVNNMQLHGVLFVRSDNNTAQFRGNGSAQIFGAIVVQGTSDITGGLRIVYLDTSGSGPGRKLPESTRLGRVAGSWLDSNRGGF